MFGWLFGKKQVEETVHTTYPQKIQHKCGCGQWEEETMPKSVGAGMYQYTSGPWESDGMCTTCLCPRKKKYGNP